MFQDISAMTVEVPSSSSHFGAALTMEQLTPYPVTVDVIRSIAAIDERGSPGIGRVRSTRCLLH
jgi:hypothetical protein